MGEVMVSANESKEGTGGTGLSTVMVAVVEEHTVFNGVVRKGLINKAVPEQRLKQHEELI